MILSVRVHSVCLAHDSMKALPDWGNFSISTIDTVLIGANVCDLNAICNVYVSNQVAMISDFNVGDT